ncbi:MAG: integrin alpha, partial [Planctomycetota bacterium]
MKHALVPSTALMTSAILLSICVPPMTTAWSQSLAAQPVAAINGKCPRSGKPVAADSLTWYRGVQVGFCNTHCRDDFAGNVAARPDDSKFFDQIIDASPVVKIPTTKERQFDFWLGKWHVVNRHLQPDGSWSVGGSAIAEIQSVLGGRAILERWTGQGSLQLRGFSLRTYDAEQQRWEIVLNWHSGAPASFSMMVGNFSGQHGDFLPPQGPKRTRFRFSKAREKSCQWDQSISRDGVTWTTNWIMSFQRIGEATALSAKELVLQGPAASTRGKFPGARQLDWLIGGWAGLGDSDHPTVRRTTAILDGYALLTLTAYGSGSSSIDVLAYDPQRTLWFGIGMHEQEPDCHWLTGHYYDKTLYLTEMARSDNGLPRQTLRRKSDERYEQTRHGPVRSGTTLRSRAQLAPNLDCHRVSAPDAGHAVPPTPVFASDRLKAAQSLLALQLPVPAQKILADLVAADDARPQVRFLLGYVQHLQKQYAQAEANYLIAEKQPATQLMARYNLACLCSLQQRSDEAFRYLKAMKQAGYKNWQQVAADPDFANLRQDPRFAAYSPARLADDKLFAEPTRILHKFVGEAPGDQFGWTARRAGDWDRDGVEDFVASAPTHGGSGKVYVYSSRSGKLLWSQEGQPGQRFGNSAVGCGDVNGDKVPDLLVGAPDRAGGSKPGSAYVFSGDGGAELLRLDGFTPGDQFGYEVSELGDINGDGSADFFVGALSGNGEQPRSGCGYAYSGTTGKKMFALHGERTGDGFGNAAACAANGDGSFTLAVGANNSGINTGGRVYVYRITQGQPTLAYKIDGDANSVHLGQMFLSFPGDLNRDGFPDLFASDFSDQTTAPGAGKIVVCSGSDGVPLLTIAGQRPGEGLGTSVSDAGDVNGDG